MPLPKTNVPIPSSPAALLEQGIQAMREEQYAEGLMLFTLAKEQIEPQQRELSTLLDHLIQSYSTYYKTQQALHEVAKHFVEADMTLQKQLVCLEQSLSTLPIQPPVSTIITSRIADVIATPHFVAPPVQLAEEETLPDLYCLCFGHFTVQRQGKTVKLCTNRNGQTILRYLLSQPDRRASMDVLMSILWPNDEPEVAHHKLQVAVSALRRSLNIPYLHDSGGGYILCKQGTYMLNTSIPIRTDSDAFVELYEEGRKATAAERIRLYQQAFHYYRGPFLLEDLYADWSTLRREQLSQMYQHMCSTLINYSIETQHLDDALTWINALLKENPYDETAYRSLMHTYSTQGRRSEALRAYQRCRQLLLEELGVEPMPETVNLFHRILANE